MFTVFACRSCGNEWSSEGTPHSECSRCGDQGRVIKDDYYDYCIECQQPIEIGEDGKERCGCPADCPCGCDNNPARCVYSERHPTQLAADFCPACDGTGYVPVSQTIKAECKACNATGQAAKA